MTFPRLEDIEDSFLNRKVMDSLGDSISYKPLGGSYAPIRGYVDFGEQERDLETGKIIAQEISVEVMRADVPVRPSATSRLTITQYGAQIFRPVNVRLSEDGRHWLFEVEKVSA